MGWTAAPSRWARMTGILAALLSALFLVAAYASGQESHPSTPRLFVFFDNSDSRESVAPAQLERDKRKSDMVAPALEDDDPEPAVATAADNQDFSGKAAVSANLPAVHFSPRPLARKSAPRAPPASA